jgi:hypothetical protein
MASMHPRTTWCCIDCNLWMWDESDIDLHVWGYGHKVVVKWQCSSAWCWQAFDNWRDLMVHKEIKHKFS